MIQRLFLEIFVSILHLWSRSNLLLQDHIPMPGFIERLGPQAISTYTIQTAVFLSRWPFLAFLLLGMLVGAKPSSNTCTPRIQQMLGQLTVLLHPLIVTTTLILQFCHGVTHPLPGIIKLFPEKFAAVEC
uniref:(northern house mosquito) hypothetical protein n=1 Tax=Culex pipiens TaxID=7175 RepID=A0A8D8MI11_CULPI